MLYAKCIKIHSNLAKLIIREEKQTFSGTRLGITASCSNGHIFEETSSSVLI